MKLTYFVVLAVVGATLPAYANQPLYSTGKLDNGLTYHIFKIPSAGKRLMTRMNVGVGAADENAGEEGIAHITEHMVFQSSPQNPQGLSNRLMKDGWQMGRHFNALTTYDYTRYMLTPPRGVKQLDEALLIYRQILQPKQFSAADWEKEQQVILSEWRQQQSLQNRLSRQQHELLYKGARQGRYAPIGRLEAIEKADMKTAGDFHNRWYGVNNAVLVVMGNVSIDETSALIQKLFGSLQPVTLSERRYEEYEPALQNGWHIAQVADRDNADNKLSLVFRFKKQPASAYEEYAYQRLLDNFAAFIINRRIQQSGEDVVLKMDTLGRNTGVLVFQSETGTNQHSEMLDVLRHLRQDILNTPATNEELAQYRKALHGNLSPQKAGIPNDLNKVAAISDETVLRGLPMPDAETQTIDRSQLYRINAKAVNERIADWLNAPDKMIEVQAQADEKVKLPEVSELSQEVSSHKNGSDGLIEPHFAENQGGSILAERHDAKLNLHYLTLSNGDMAVVMKLPVAGNNLYFKALSNVGYWQQPQQAWQGEILADVLVRSTPQGMSAANFKQWQQKKGIQRYRFRLGGYYQTTDVQAAKTALQSVLQLYRQQQTAPDFSGWQQVVKREESRFKVAQYAKSGRQRDALNTLQYGRNALMPSESLAYAGLNEAAFRQQWQTLASAPTTYYIVSNLPIENVKPWVAQYLADIPRQAMPSTKYPWQSGRQIRQIAANDTQGTDVQALSWQTIARLSPAQHEQIKLLNNIANARLKDELRGKQQSVYAVKFQAEPNIGQNRMQSRLSFNTSSEQARSAWQTAQKVLNALSDNIGFSEARNLRKLFVEQENARRRKPELWLERLVISHQSYGDARYLTEISNIPANFSRNQLRETAKLMWSAENEKILLMTPRP
ncbi:M16 family metallopeptidase [Neisseria yangbaofengii]|uniref:M16 family metallopeptidase n=1 Tax=Neisseria yangbaofengii TaxID=2709396 RepID=UPI0013EA62F1|nr:insulinase family protein [Neisseria yangbaofengii]